MERLPLSPYFCARPSSYTNRVLPQKATPPFQLSLANRVPSRKIFKSHSSILSRQSPNPASHIPPNDRDYLTKRNFIIFLRGQNHFPPIFYFLFLKQSTHHFQATPKGDRYQNLFFYFPLNFKANQPKNILIFFMQNTLRADEVGLFGHPTACREIKPKLQRRFCCLKKNAFIN